MYHKSSIAGHAASVCQPSNVQFLSAFCQIKIRFGFTGYVIKVMIKPLLEFNKRPDHCAKKEFTVVKNRRFCYFLESRNICLKFYLLESRSSPKIFYFLQSRKQLPKIYFSRQWELHVVSCLTSLFSTNTAIPEMK